MSENPDMGHPAFVVRTGLPARIDHPVKYMKNLWKNYCNIWVQALL